MVPQQNELGLESLPHRKQKKTRTTAKHYGRNTGKSKKGITTLAPAVAVCYSTIAHTDRERREGEEGERERTGLDQDVKLTDSSN